MADIFGRNPADYEHIGAQRSAGLYEANRQALQRRGLIHDFDAVGTAGERGFHPISEWELANLSIQKRAEANAQAATFLTNNVQAILAQFQEVVYLGGMRVFDFIPVRDVPEGATSYLHRVVDKYGEGDFISSDGTDAPAAEAVMRPVTVPVGYAGITGKWTVEDLRATMFGGFPLDSETIDAASRGAMTHIARVGFNGHATRFQSDGFTTGLINAPSTGDGAVAQVDANQTFAAGSVQQMIDVVQNSISKIIEDTEETYPSQIGGELCIALPTAQYNLITRARYGEGSDMTAARWIMANNNWTGRPGGTSVTFKSLPELADAAGSNNDRMVTYVKDTRVIEQGHAIMPRVLSIREEGYVIMARFEYKFGPTFIGRPDGVQYTDII